MEGLRPLDLLHNSRFRNLGGPCAHLDMTRLGMLRLTGDGIVVQGGQPVATILAGASETSMEVPPGGLAVAAHGHHQTPLGPAHEHIWRWHDEWGYVLDWIITDLDDAPGITLRAVFYNGSAAPVRLRDVTLFRTAADGVVCAGDPAAWWLSTLGLSPYTGPLDRTPRPLARERRSMWELFNVPRERLVGAGAVRWRSFSNVLTLYTVGGRRGLIMGAVGTEADVRFDCAMGPNGTSLQIVSVMTDVRLKPGEARQSEEVLILAAPYETAVPQLLRWVGATHGQRTHRGPIVGWCSWYDLFSGITAAHVLAVVDAVQALGNRLPLQVIQVDQGYEWRLGDWACNERFPAGWGPLSRRSERPARPPASGWRP